MNDAPLTTAEQKEIRSMVLGMVDRGCPPCQVRQAMKDAALLYRELKAVSAGPAKQRSKCRLSFFCRLQPV